MIIQTEVTKHNFDLGSIVNEFEKKETPLTGSLIIHKGKVKSPGKNVLNLSHILLQMKKPEGNIRDELFKIGELAGKKFHLQQIYINHRLGQAHPGEDILLVIVSASDRINAFSAAQCIVDEIKKEKIITLTEIEG